MWSSAPQPMVYADDRSTFLQIYKQIFVYFRSYIWDHVGKCIEISTNMPSNGQVIEKYTLKLVINKLFCVLKTLAAWEALIIKQFIKAW